MVDKFCFHCGKPLDAGARFCAHCGAPVNTPAAAQQKPVRPMPVQPTQQCAETVLANSNCQFAKGAGVLASRGNVLITNRRLIYYKHGIAKTLLLGHAVHLTKGDYDIEIPYTNIQSMYWNQQGFSRYLGVRLRNGEHHRIYFIDFDNSMRAIGQAMPGVPIPKGK